MNNNVQDENTVHSGDYWKKMYDELETQMYSMMEMTLDLLEKESNNSNGSYSLNNFNALHAPSDYQKEFRRLQLFEHRIKVTYIGRVTLQYISFKRKLKKLLKR